MARSLVADTEAGPAVLLKLWAVNERMNQIVMEGLNPGIWRVRPPGQRVRTIASILAHLHNIRRKWIRLSAPQMTLPLPLDPRGCTKKETMRALADSARRCSEMLGAMLVLPREWKFLRDGWAKPWPVGTAMVVYMISHEAHHRGQICMLAHQFGSPFPRSLGGEIWNWERLGKECGYPLPRRGRLGGQPLANKKKRRSQRAPSRNSKA